jgi:mono/diheme cytochrome c family protein
VPAAIRRSASPRPEPQAGTRSALILGRLALAALPPLGLLGGITASRAADPAHGRYLAEAAGCDRCHTETTEGAPSYGGGRTFDTVFGRVTTPNITPDRKTGIGGWSESDFIRAMRWGIAPDDSHYLPVFPFPYYNRLTDGDLADIKGFLDTIPPVSRPGLPRAGSLALWERARAAVAIAATPMPGPWRDDPAKDPVWNRGAYLVATIGRCGQCHTPRTWLGAPDPHRFLAGAPAGTDGLRNGRKIPNITSDRKAGIGNWSTDDIVTMLTEGTTPDFDEVGGSMAEIVKNTAKLSEEDRRAIAVYLQTVPPVSTPTVSMPPGSGPERK